MHKAWILTSPPSQPALPTAWPISAGESLSFQSIRLESTHFPQTSSTLLSNLEFELSISVATTLTQASINLSSHLDHHSNLLSGFLTSALVPQVYPQLTKYCDPIKTRVSLCPCVTYHPVSSARWRHSPHLTVVSMTVLPPALFRHFIYCPSFQWISTLWAIEKSKEFQKNICFCLIDYAKAFDCVDHNTLCTFFKEIGIPDQLNCLLRNLYAGQEATARTGHGTRDLLKVGERVYQGCILSPCLFNLYTEYNMQNARLDESQAGIKIAGRNINNLRYANTVAAAAAKSLQLCRLCAIP